MGLPGRDAGLRGGGRRSGGAARPGAGGARPRCPSDAGGGRHPRAGGGVGGGGRAEVTGPGLARRRLAQRGRDVGDAVGALERGVIRRTHATLLAVFGHLPVSLRRAVARRVGVSDTMGALVLLEDADRVLLIRPSYRRAWSLPGGLLRRGEEPATAAVREVGEEVGVSVVGLSGGAVVVDVPA